MNIPELQVVVEMIGGLGGAAAGGFTWWLVLQAFGMVLAYSLGGAIAFFTYKVSVGAINRVPQDQALMTLRELLGVGSDGVLIDSERRAIVEKVRELLKGVKHEERRV